MSEPIDYDEVGLSPPTRGNRGAFPLVIRGVRSIPAHAGEPNFAAPPDIVGEVYPRPRGGTGVVVIIVGLLLGLSPPTRGNHSRACARRR